MKAIFKISSLLLSIILMMCFVACGGKPSGNGDESQNQNIDSGDKEPDSTGPVNPDDIEDTETYLIKGGKTSYKIVIPANASANILTAAEELNEFVSEGTGATFDVISDNEASYSSEAHYVSIGETTLKTQANVSTKNGLGRNGTQIVTKGNSIFLFGNNDLAALYATYDFLYYILDFDYIYTDCYNLKRNVSEIKLKKYDLVNVPDFEYRAGGYGWCLGDALMRNRMRVQYYFSNLLSINGEAFHNALNYVEKSDLFAAHKGYWTSTDGTQLCYTAHGNSTEYNLMQEECLKTLQSALKNDTESSIITLTQEDTGAFCSCDACTKKSKECGAKSALQLLFVNDLKEKLDAWFKTEDGKQYYRDYVMTFASYHDTSDVPAHYDQTTGKYVPNKDAKGNEIKCKDGVVVWYAPIHGDFTHSLYDPQNENVLSTIKGWNAVSNGKIFFWTYSTTYINYFALYNSFDSMVDTYKLAKEMGTVFIFDQGQTNTTTNLSWSILKSYLNAKLAWDSNVDVGALTDKFFTNYFGPVATGMKELYMDQRAHLRYLSENTSYSCARSASNTAIVQEAYWPKPVLLSWLNKFNAVVDDLADLKRENEELYNRYYYRVANERLSVLYLLVSLYDKNTSADLILEYKMQFKADADALKIERSSEYNWDTIELLYTNWGIL